MRVMVTNRFDPPPPIWRFVGGLAQVGRHRLLAPLVFLALVDDQRCIRQSKIVMGQDQSEEVLVQRFRLVHFWPGEKIFVDDETPYEQFVPDQNPEKAGTNSFAGLLELEFVAGIVSEFDTKVFNRSIEWDWIGAKQQCDYEVSARS